MCNLWNIHHAMFPPSFGEKNEKLNSNMSLGGWGGSKEKRKPLIQMATPKETTSWQAKKGKKKKIHAQENFKEKNCPPKKRKTQLTSKKKNRGGQLP